MKGGGGGGSGGTNGSSLLADAVSEAGVREGNGLVKITYQP